jgi:short-subunit dehydrogenase
MRIRTNTYSFLLLALPTSKAAEEETAKATTTTRTTLLEAQGAVAAATHHFLGTPAIPEKIREIIPTDGFIGNLLQLKACTEDGEVPDDYVAPYTSEGMCDDYFMEKFGSVETALEKYQPSVVVIVGGSVGIGRANACYWAARGKTVISLATRPVHLVGKNEATAIDCDFSKNIINYQYDITEPEKQRKLSSILRENNIDSIDLLLLNAGRAIFGDLRDYTSKDLIGAYMNNVFGLHDVWIQARKFLNPNLAVVFGMSSRLAESRFLAKSDVYTLTKRAVYDLILSYAQQEEFVQPNTHYAAIIQGAAQTSVSLNYYAPSSNPKCIPEYTTFGLFSNTLNNIDGLRINELALKFHKAYARIAAAADLNPNDRADIPQSFGWAPPENWGQIEEIWYNSRILFPEQVSVCYSESWDNATEFLLNGCPDEDTGKSSCPLVGEIIIPIIDPRQPFQCSAV